MKMSQMNEGESAVLRRLECPNAFARRLREMGFVEGERVTCVRIATLKSPILFHIKGADIALRKCDAARLEVSR